MSRQRPPHHRHVNNQTGRPATTGAAPERLHIESAAERLGALQQSIGNRGTGRLVARRIDALQRQPNNTPTLRVGSRQPAVSILQHFLVDAGAAIAVDGIFGPQTLRTVRAFQRSANLAADGIVGPLTWSALQTGGVRIDTGATSGLAAAGLGDRFAAKLTAIAVTLQPFSTGAGTVEVTHTPPWQPLIHPALADFAGLFADSGAGSPIPEEQAGETAGFPAPAVAGDAASLAAAAGSALQAMAGLDAAARQQLAAPLATAESAASQAAFDPGQLTDPVALSELDNALADFQVFAANATPLAGGGAQGNTTIDVTKDDTYTFRCDDIACAGQELSNHESIHGEVAHVVRIQHKNEVKFDLDEVTGKVVKATLDFRLEKVLPEWTNVAAVGQRKPCWQQEWNRFNGAITAHENHHVAIFKRFLAGLHLQCINQTETKAGEIVDKALEQMDEAQELFDTTTDHGKTANPSTNFNAGISC